MARTAPFLYSLLPVAWVAGGGLLKCPTTQIITGNIVSAAVGLNATATSVYPAVVDYFLNSITVILNKRIAIGYGTGDGIKYWRRAPSVPSSAVLVTRNIIRTAGTEDHPMQCQLTIGNYILKSLG
jgi:hypothetical protein